MGKDLGADPGHAGGINTLGFHDELEKVVREKDVWASLLSLPLPQPGSNSRKWMEGGIGFAC